MLKMVGFLVVWKAILATYTSDPERPAYKRIPHGVVELYVALGVDRSIVDVLDSPIQKHSFLQCASECLSRGSICKAFTWATASQQCILGSTVRTLYSQNEDQIFRVLGITTAFRTDIALGKPVNASSYWSAEIHKPEYITDGLVDGNFIHTFTDAAPWIRIYLLALYDVTVIKIWNRPLTYHEEADARFYNVTFKVAKVEEGFTDDGTLCNIQEEILAPGVEKEYPCYDTLTGQIVQLQMIGTPVKPLHIQEIEVHGYLSLNSLI